MIYRKLISKMLETIKDEEILIKIYTFVKKWSE
jgi:hypothetical protein